MMKAKEALSILSQATQPEVAKSKPLLRAWLN